MGLFSKPAKKSAAPKATPLTAKQRALLEEEQRVKAEMDRCARFVKDAPERAAKIQREQRDELIRRAATMHRGGGTTRVVDRRFELDANVANSPVQKKTRAERRQGRLMFFILLLALAGAIFYFYYTVTHS